MWLPGKRELLLLEDRSERREKPRISCDDIMSFEISLN
jgi:hypothetical protein